MSRVIESIAPARLGAGFRWLLSSSWVAHIGDGMSLAAGPLLVASQTSNAVLVAMAALLQRLPWLLLGLYAGAIADRVDRKRAVVIADTCRALVVGVLAISIVTGHASIAVVLAAMLLLGVAEVFADTSGQTLLPMLVRHDDLGIGNARLQTSYLLGGQVLGPPIGAFLFAAGMALPFVTQSVLVLVSVLLLVKIAVPTTAGRDIEGTHVLRDISEGVRWLWHNDAVRTLALVIVAFNVTWAAAWAVLVLYALNHLHMSSLGYGLLTTSAAIGGLLSTTSYGWIEKRFDLATVMRVCLSLEVAVHLAFALTTNGYVALVLMFVFGAYAFVWGAVSITVRQRATPRALQGRVGSVYMVCVYGGMAVGQVLGGAIAARWGLTAPFWFAFVGAGITLILVWRQLGNIAHVAPADDDPEITPIA
jgi:MFS family permease